MKLIRTNNNGLSRLSDLDNWFRGSFAGWPALTRFLDNDLGLPGLSRLGTDIHEDENNYYAIFEVPGAKKEDVKVELHDRLLTVAVNRKEGEGDHASTYSATRSISVPDSVKSDVIGAKLEDGLLTVTLPKNEVRKPRQIEIA